MTTEQKQPMIAVHGSTGRLGALIVQQLGDQFAGAVSRDGTIPKCDVVIDVSSPAGINTLIESLEGQALVIGTTGGLPMAAIQEYSTKAAVVIAANFSAGIPILLDLVNKAVGALPDGWDIEVVEAHHSAKVDSPSGTAKRIVATIQEATQSQQGIATHSLRVGDTFGEHTVWLCGEGERIELKPVATRREVFAIGAKKWANWAVKQPNGLYIK